MTVAEYIKDVAKKFDTSTDINMMITIAYYMGREEACKLVSDDYSALISQMRDRADGLRYYKMANGVIGKVDHLYYSDYAQDVTRTFGSDDVPDSIAHQSDSAQC